MIKLVVKAQLTEGGTKDYSYEFDQPLITIGRLKENDIQLPLASVSGYHAQIEKENDNYYLIDRGSINGTFLNGERLVAGEKKLLSDSDLIKIQTFDLYFSTGINVLGIDSGATVQVARQMVMEVLGSWQTSTAEKPRVILMGGPENGKQYELTEGTTLISGRTSGVDIVIEHPSVSRRHAELSLSWSGAFVKDLNSANGTFINDERISGSRRLRDRDEIRFGQQSSSSPVILIFSNPAEALLSKLEDMQMTDSTPGKLQSKEVTDAAAKEGEKIAEEGAAGESAEPAAEGAEAAEKKSEEEAAESAVAVDEKEEVPVQLPEARRGYSLGAIGGIVLGLSVLGLIVFFIWGKGSLTPPLASPEKGSTGDLIHVQGSFDPEDVKAVKILDQDAFVLKRDKDGLQIKLPDFPNLSGSETDSEILVMGEKDVLSRINFKVLIAPRIQNMNPLSGGVGSEVRIKTNMPGQSTSVLFGSDLAGTRVDGDDIIATVPSPADQIPDEGLKVPVTVRINNMRTKNTMDFIILPGAPVIEKPQEVFRLSFVAKPYATPLGFNEYSVETNIGPLLVLVAKDDSGSSRERAEMVAKNLNNAVTYFQSNPDAQVTISNQDNAYSLFADGAVDGTKSPLLRVLSEDTYAYSKLNQRGVELEELAKWWQMLLGAYYRTFVQVKSPEDTGIVASGGLVFEQIENFYAVGNHQSGGRYYAVDFLNTVPADQKSKLLSLSFGLPARVAKVEGTWSGTMDNKLYSNIRESSLDLDLKLRQQGTSISGTATLVWRMDLGGSGGFKNEFRKTIGMFQVFGQYRKTSSFPVEFSMTEKDGRALDFVGKMEGRNLRGSYVIRSNGQEGGWSVGLK
jgi:pSer/pThr/pTyr-binding forkhead associated (FHA) protein